MERKLILNPTPNVFFLAIIFLTALDSIASIAPFYLLARLFIYSILLYIIFNKKFITFFDSVGIALVPISLFIHFLMAPSSISINLRPALNILHPFILYLIFNNLDNKEEIFSKENSKLFLRISYLFIFLSLVLGKVTNLGNRIGSRGAIDGLGGFFIGANEIGIIMIIVIIYIYWLINQLSKMEAYTLLFIFSILGCLVFTKSSIIAALIAMGILITHSKAFRIFFILIFSLILLYYSTKIIKAYNFLKNNTFFSDAFTNIFAFIFRGRQNYFSAFFLNLEITRLKIIELIFIGFGSHTITGQLTSNIWFFRDAPFKDLEMDFFDLFFSLGLLFTLYYFYYVTRFFITIYKNSNLKVGALLFLILLHAFLAGHVFFSTQCINILILFYFFVRHNPQDKLGNPILKSAC